MTSLVVNPTTRLGKVVLDAPDASGRTRSVFISRWATDVLGCEVWCVLSTVDLGDGASKTSHRWFTTPAQACQAAVRVFQVAGYGPAPVAPSMLLRHPIAPTGFVLADAVRA